MRAGDFGVEVIGAHDDVHEISSGHVLARRGTQYTLRLRNFGPLRCVCDVRIDGERVTAGGLVLDPYGTTDLERPVDQDENGRFTVVAEGDETVFGPDGGRDNPNLGLIEAHFRRELPHASRPPETLFVPAIDRTPSSDPSGPPGAPAPGRPMAPPEWTPPSWQANAGAPRSHQAAQPAAPSDPSGPWRVEETSAPSFMPSHAIERAAGTGLTGHSSQQFMPVVVGQLEHEETVIRLRLAIGTDEALAAARPLHVADTTPARPAARP